MSSQAENGSHRAAFLDRDGVLIEILRDAELGVLYTAFHPEHVRPAKSARDALVGLADLGFQRIVVSNQPGVAKGHFTHEQLDRTNARMRELLPVDAVYSCPHHPDFGGACDCRKPKAGLLLRAARERGVDLSRSVMIGDSPDDVRAGQAAGVRTVLVNGGRCELCPSKGADGPRPDATVRDLGEAVEWIARNLP
jgi:D-glycero-D-manno-heptose 1,7-bisphosphate phosphatase